MADTVVEVAEEGVVEVEVGDDVPATPAPAAATPPPAPGPKAPPSAADEAAAALTAAQKRTEEERRRREASDATADAERRRADEATRVANQSAEEARLAREEASNATLVGINSGIEAATRELASARADYKSAFDAGDPEKQADAMERLSSAKADIKILTGKKADFEAAAKAPAAPSGRVEAPAQSPFERYVSTFAPRAQAWLRAHSDYVPAGAGGDAKKNAAMMKGHYAALEEGHQEGTADYFRVIEEAIGERSPVSAAAETTPAGDPPPAPARAAPKPPQPRPSAPPSRDPPGTPATTRTLRLNEAQQEAALFSYPAKPGEDEAAWKKRAFGTYATEFIRAQAEGKIGRLTH